MIKICGKSLLKPLILLFQNLAKLLYFPDIWKRSNIIPVHKNNDKQLVENYRPISLLSIFRNIFQKIIFNKIYHFLLQERLLNPNQSGFRPSDSCINQLLAITHEIFEAFDCNPTLEVRSVFLDISKCFLNSGPLVFQVSFIIFLVTIFQIDSKELLESRVILIH